MQAAWIRALVLLPLLTLGARDHALLLLAVVVVASWLAGAALLERVFARLAVSEAISTTEAFPGDTVDVHLRIANRSILPLPWLRVRQVVQARLQQEPPTWLASLPAGEVHHVQYRLHPSRRGVYRIGRVEVEAGDWFGLWRREGDVEVGLWLTVFPRPERVDVLHSTSPRRPEGPRRDPTSPFRAWEPQGLREYRRGDPLRWIAWKATARRGELVVRDFPPVWERTHVVVLDLRAERWPARGRAEWVEHAVSVAAGWIVGTGDRDEPVGLYAHGVATRYEPEAHNAPGGASGAGRRLTVVASGPRHVGALGPRPLDAGNVRLELPARRGAQHRRRLLAALAGLEAADDPSFVHEVPAGVTRMSPRASVFWLAGIVDADTMTAARLMTLAGHAVTLAVAQGGAPRLAAGGVRIHTLVPGEGAHGGA